MKIRYPRVSFTCQRCAKCCMDSEERDRRIILLKCEVKEISAYTGLPPEKFCRKAPEDLLEIYKPYEYEMLKVNGKCVFLNGNTCTIYEKRPLVCRFHPFWLEKEDDTWVFGVDTKCPGVSTQNPFDEQYFLKLLQTALTKLNKT